MNANRELQNYPLPTQVRRALVGADRLAVHMHRHGLPVPDVIELSQHEYRTIDSVVRLVSGGASTMRDVTWYGRAVVSVARPRVVASSR